MNLRPWRYAWVLGLVLAGCGRTDRIQLPELTPQDTQFELEARSLPDAERGQDYQQDIRLFSAPAAQEVTWTVVAGALPDGLALQPVANGVRLIGRPTEVGTFNFVLEAQDSGGRSARAPYVLRVVGNRSLAITPVTLPDGVLGQAYQAQITASGGQPPYVWRIASGRVPFGLGVSTLGDGAFELVGVPEVRGLWEFAVEVVDAQGASDQRVFTILVLDPQSELRIGTAGLSAAQQGVRYEARIDASGGRPPYRWQAMPLPPGLSLATVGTPATSLTGVPSEVGTFPLTVFVEDADGQVAVRDFALVVQASGPMLQLMTTSLPPARVAEVYAGPLLARGGQPPYRWRLSQGDLPRGLFLSSTGTPGTTISGTPFEATTARFEVEVTDQQGTRSARAFVLEVQPEIFPLRLTTTQLPDGLAGGLYQAELFAEGGVPPYTWSVASGTLPPGVQLDPAGTPATQLSGQPTQAGSYVAEILVQDVDGRRAMRTFTIDIAGPATPPTISTVSLPTTTECQGYYAELEVTGGLGPFSWSLVSGALPPGLSLQTMGTPNSSIAGYPAAVGSYSVTVQVQDSLGQIDTRTLSLQSDANPNLARWAVLVSRIAGTRDIYLSDLCTASPTPAIRATTGAGQLFGNFVALSEDGRKLAYIGDYATSGVQELFVVDLSGTVPTAPVRVHPPAAAFQDVRSFAWSPDGRFLAFFGRLNGPSQVWVVDVSQPAMPGVARVVSSPSGLANPSVTDLRWSPDSRYLAYRGNLEVSGRADIYLTTPGSTTGHQRISTFTAQNASSLSMFWSPSSQGIAYVADQDVDGRFDLYWVPTPAGGPGAPVRLSNLSANADVQSARVAYSFDGAYLAFTAGGGGSNTELFAVTLSGPAPSPQQRLHAPLPSNRSVADFLWSPTAPRLVYVADQDLDNVNELYLLNLTGPSVGTTVKVNLPIDINSDVRFGTGNLEWSYDGTWLGFIVNRTTGGPIEAFTTDLRGALPITRPVGPARTDPSLDVRSLHMAGHNNRMAVVGNLVSANNTELFWIDFEVGAPSNPRRVNPTFTMGANVSLSTDAVAFRPDGTGLLYIADPSTDFVNEAFIVSVLGPRIGPTVGLQAPLTVGERAERILVP